MARLRFQTREDFLRGFGGREGCAAADAVLDALERCARAYDPRPRVPAGGTTTDSLDAAAVTPGGS